MEVKNESEAAQSCPTLSDPMDCSLPSSSHGIFQARVLEWVAIAFSVVDLKACLINFFQYDNKFSTGTNTDRDKHKLGARYVPGNACSKLMLRDDIPSLG